MFLEAILAFLLMLSFLPTIVERAPAPAPILPSIKDVGSPLLAPVNLADKREPKVAAPPQIKPCLAASENLLFFVFSFLDII